PSARRAPKTRGPPSAYEPSSLKDRRRTNGPQATRPSRATAIPAVLPAPGPRARSPMPSDKHKESPGRSHAPDSLHACNADRLVHPAHAAARHARSSLLLLGLLDDHALGREE